MVWQPEIDELNYRKHLAEQMGSDEGIERQRKRGKLTVHERIAKLADPGSFRELGVNSVWDYLSSHVLINLCITFHKVYNAPNWRLR